MRLRTSRGWTNNPQYEHAYENSYSLFCFAFVRTRTSSAYGTLFTELSLYNKRADCPRILEGRGMCGPWAVDILYSKTRVPVRGTRGRATDAHGHLAR
eukprot:scaffold97757_cov45-Prasinocladus_malaysianus.AAC.1